MADGSSTDPIGGNGPQLLTLAANEADTEPSGSVHLPPMDEMSVGWPAIIVRPAWMNS